MITIDQDAMRLSLGQFSDSLYRLSQETGKEMGVLVKSTGRLLAIDMVIMTQPFSGKDGNINEAGIYRGADDRAKGENAVMRDVGRIYKSISHVYGEVAAQSHDAAAGFYSEIKQGKIPRAMAILRFFGIELGAQVGKFDGGSLHRAIRNNRGRVARSETVRLIVTNPSVLRSYVKELMRRVGEAKGGWADAAKALGGTRGIPQWVTRNAVGRGGATDNSDSFNHPHVVIYNRVKYINAVCDDGAQFEAIHYRTQKMETQIKFIIEAKAKKEGFAVH